MSTIRSLIAGVAGVAAVAAGAGATAVVASTGSASAGTSASFTLKAHQGSESNIDLGASGFSAGDEDLGVSTLTRNGKVVGHLVINCTVAHVGKTADQLCEFVLRLGKGQITASGTVSSGKSGPGTFVLPVLGGTGRYQGAAGQIAVTASNGPTVPIAVSLR